MSNSKSGIYEGYEKEPIDVKTADNTKTLLIRIPKDRLRTNAEHLLNYNKDIASEMMTLLALGVPLIQNQFNPFLGVNAEWVRGIFIGFFIYAVIKVFGSIHKIFSSKYLTIENFLSLCEDNENYVNINFRTRFSRWIKAVTVNMDKKQ